MMKWLFLRLFPAYGGSVCFLQSETVVQTKQRQPWVGVSPILHLNEEKALGTRLAPSRRHIEKNGEGLGTRVFGHIPVSQ